MSAPARKKCDRSARSPARHSAEVVSSIAGSERPTCTGDIEMRPANQVLLVLVVDAVDDESINEALEEDGGGAGPCESSARVAEIHSGARDLGHVAFVEGHAPDAIALGSSGGANLGEEGIAVGEDSRVVVPESYHDSAGECGCIDDGGRVVGRCNVVQGVGEDKATLGVCTTGPSVRRVEEERRRRNGKGKESEREA